MVKSKFGKDFLTIDAKKTEEQLTEFIRAQIHRKLKKGGAVLGISGGIDSSVVASLCVRALGPERVLGVSMPEKDSNRSSLLLAEKLAMRLGIGFIVEDMTAALGGHGCYQRRDEAIKRVFPDFTSQCKSKITIATDILKRESLNYFKLTVEYPNGTSRSNRMPAKEFLQIVAASNLKQRSRMATLYFHAERLNWAVVGTANKDEHDLGFFVKYGDGGADLKPIAHLFKVQIYQLARHLGIPDEIVDRVPTADTYSAEVTQTEFFFGINFELLDLIWSGLEQGLSAHEVADHLSLTEHQVARVYKDIQQKQRSTKYLRCAPIEWIDGTTS